MATPKTQDRTRQKPRHDYESDAFYLAIEALAKRGYYDKEIAVELHLNETTFLCMKNGNYYGWSAEQNKTYSARIKQALANARLKVNALVRSTYLAAALGTKKVKNVTYRNVEIGCECKGHDPNCPKCHGTGRIMTDRVIVQTTEVELPPNMQALATWLHHHDPEWTNGEKGCVEQRIEATQKGIDVAEWIKGMATDKQIAQMQRDMAQGGDEEDEDVEDAEIVEED